MDYKDFIVFAQTQMQQRIGEGAQVRLHRITKNNSVCLDALSISEDGGKIAPTIYLNDFYEHYAAGGTMPELLDQMEHIYRKSRTELPFDAEFYHDFEKVKDRLACKLINEGRNEQLLKKIPHRSFLDLAVAVYYSFEDEAFGTGTILVHESHRKTWGVSEDALLEHARANTLKIQPWEFLSMDKILEKYCGEEQGQGADGRENSAIPMYVLTNRGNYFGAASMLFDSVLQEIAEKLGGDFWVLPSSIHECIIVPADFPTDREELQDMVSEINRCAVAEEDFLSDEVYFYQANLHKLSM